MTSPVDAPSPPNFAELYERALVTPLFRPWAEALLEDVGLERRQRILDVACGTGIVARLAHERCGKAVTPVGVDVNSEMLAVARKVAPEIDWRLGSATGLPLHDGEQFDVVCCQEGLQFFPDRPAAIREMRRALAPGGALAVSTWRNVEEAPLLLALHRVAERHLGPIVDRRHALGSDTALEELLRDGGLVDVRSRARSRTIEFADSTTFVRMNATALVGMSSVGTTLTTTERADLLDAITTDSMAVLGDYSIGEKLKFTIASNVATARR